MYYDYESVIYVRVCFAHQMLVEASAKRVVSLASQWEKHRAPLIDEHRRLKELCTNQDVSSHATKNPYLNWGRMV